jgi:hypothetical protein
MKIDPSDASLYTDSGEFLKTLHCPFDSRWERMKFTTPGVRTCDTCSRTVHDTSPITDAQLVELLHRDPEACLMVSPLQENCTVVPIGIQKKHMKSNR